MSLSGVIEVSETAQERKVIPLLRESTFRGSSLHSFQSQFKERERGNGQRKCYWYGWEDE